MLARILLIAVLLLQVIAPNAGDLINCTPVAAECCCEGDSCCTDGCGCITGDESAPTSPTPAQVRAGARESLWAPSTDGAPAEPWRDPPRIERSVASIPRSLEALPNEVSLVRIGVRTT